MKLKTIFGLGLIAIIIIGGIFVYQNRDEYFKQIIVITYPDRCQEEYVNGELVSPICEKGRIIEQQMENGTYKPQNNNIPSYPNFNISI